VLIKAELTILLAAMLLKKDIYEHIINNVERPIFDPGRSPVEDILIRIFIERNTELHTFLDLQIFSEYLKEDLIAEDHPIDIQRAVFNIFDNIKDISVEAISNNILECIVKKFMEDKVTLSTQDRFSNMSLRNEGGLEDILNDSLRELQNGSLNNNNNCYSQPLLTPAKFMIKNKYWATGIRFFDEDANGGIRSNEILGFVAPSGGGKTVFALQLAMSWIKQSNNHHSLVLNYEQPVEGDVNERLLSITTNMHIDTFRGKEMHTLPQDIQDKIFRNNKNIAKNLHVMDYSGNQGYGNEGSRSVEKALQVIDRTMLKVDQESISDELPPTLVIIDWLIPFLNRLLSKKGKIAIGEDIRGEGPIVMDALKVLKNKYNISILVMHQAQAALMGASSGRKPQLDDSQEWKAFPNFCERFYAVGTRNEHNICYFTSPKARAAETNERLVKLDGAYCRFIDAQNEFMISNNKIIPKMGEEQAYEEEDVTQRLSNIGNNKRKLIEGIEL